MTDPARIVGALLGAGLVVAFWWRYGLRVTAWALGAAERVAC